MKESKAMMKREIDFMKKKKAPKDMLKHEVAEHAAEKKKMPKYAKGGSVGFRTSANGIAKKGKTKAKKC
jgi:hypothetical protein